MASPFGMGGRTAPGIVEALDLMLLYLASDAGREVTGPVFTIDDGETL